MPSQTTGNSTDSVAQLVEQYTFNVWVLGSNPSGITNKKATPKRVAFFIALVTKYIPLTVNVNAFKAINKNNITQIQALQSLIKRNKAYVTMLLIAFCYF